MPKPTQSFIKKVTSNQRRLQRFRYLDRNSFRDTNQAKACHSLIHNLIEAYEKYAGTKSGDSIINDIKLDIYDCFLTL